MKEQVIVKNEGLPIDSTRVMEGHFQVTTHLLSSEIYFLDIVNSVSFKDREELLTRRIISLAENTTTFLIVNQRIHDYSIQLENLAYSPVEIEDCTDLYRNKIIKFLSDLISRE